MATPFYQPALDALKEPRITRISISLIEFMEAVDKDNTAKLPIAAAKLRTHSRAKSAYVFLPDAMFVEALRRLLLMPRPEEFRMLFDWNAGRRAGGRRLPRATVWTAMLATSRCPRRR